MEMGKRMAFNESEKLVQCFMKCVVDSPSPIELDAAYMYAGVKTEKFIGKMESVKKLENVEIASKANPFDNKLLDAKGVRHQLGSANGVPRHVQLSDTAGGKGTLPLPPFLQHEVLRLQPSCWWDSDGKA